MKKVLKTEEERIAYNCRKATLLIEKKQNIALNPREKMELQVHLAGCYICRIYEQQSILITAMMHQILRKPEEQLKLDKAFKDKLKKQIENKMMNN